VHTTYPPHYLPPTIFEPLAPWVTDILFFDRPIKLSKARYVTNHSKNLNRLSTHPKTQDPVPFLFSFFKVQYGRPAASPPTTNLLFLCFPSGQCPTRSVTPPPSPSLLSSAMGQSFPPKNVVLMLMEGWNTHYTGYPPKGYTPNQSPKPKLSIGRRNATLDGADSRGTPATANTMTSPKISVFAPYKL